MIKCGSEKSMGNLNTSTYSLGPSFSIKVIREMKITAQRLILRKNDLFCLQFQSINYYEWIQF